VIRAGPSPRIIPSRLEPGARVALVAPASPFKEDDLAAGVAELARLGFEAVYDERLFARRRFVAGTAAERAAALTDAWRDPSVRGIVAMRGGYGSAQLLPELDAATLRGAAKVFVGYSDVTALLTFYVQHGVTCFHGPMVERRLAAGESGYHRESLLAAVTRAEPMGRLAPPGLDVLRDGEAAGTLVGGTLSQLTASLGTPYAFECPEAAILFIEDVAERPFRIHRMLTQLAQAGQLARASALVFGEMPGCDEPGGGHLIRDVLAEFVESFRGPVLFGFPSGHTSGPSWTLPFGVQARVQTGPAPAVIIEEPAVA
jgi:muramoyltetrapeptide carboxypeptidase